jgi:ABC-type nitrate/sulfonate/bicarbonate transport system substrate-binding protein
MPRVHSRLCAVAQGLCAVAALLALDASAAGAAKVKMVFPGPVTTFSLPYLVAQEKVWMGDLEVEDVHVTGDANAMRVLLSGNADIGLIGTLNVLASIHAGAGIRAIHSWQPIGDYSLVLATGKGNKLADLDETRTRLGYVWNVVRTEGARTVLETADAVSEVRAECP